MRNFRDFAAPPPAIATRAELDQRLAERNRRDDGPHPTPSGPDAAEVRQQVRDMADKRIGYLEDRLNALRTGLRQDQSRASNEGRAKAQFERSR